MEDSIKIDRFTISLILALSIHALSFVVLRYSDNILPKITRADNNAPVEIVPIEELQKPIVQTTRNEDEEDKSEAKYAGEFRNRVKKETKAPLQGKFQEGGKSQSQVYDKSDTGDRAEPQISDLMPQGRNPFLFSDDLETGNNTLLNTDSVVYASFFNRIADTIYESWVGYARDAVWKRPFRKGELEPKTYITKIRITLNRSGDVTEIDLLESSGIPDFDEAPKKAFWDSEPFRNPPKQMFKEDGYARFVYEFHFELGKSGFQILPQQM
jgi:TonB family protein